MTSGFLAFTAILVVGACNVSLSWIFGARATQTFRSVSFMLLFSVIPIVRVWKNEDIKKETLKVIKDFKM